MKKEYQWQRGTNQTPKIKKTSEKNKHLLSPVRAFPNRSKKRKG